MYTIKSTITSQDGTHIAYEKHGSGPSLILVHGAFVDRKFWGPSVPLLAKHFTVYAMDRRGHGASGMPRQVVSECPI